MDAGFRIPGRKLNHKTTMEIYRVTAWGTSVNIGVTGAAFVDVSAICKTNSLPQDPYIVVNELIAAEMGRVLRLPVPPGFVVTDGNQTPHFASLDFNLTGVSLPPIVPDQFEAAFQAYIGAILVFDIFICNSDRHAGNLSADYNNPQRFNLFDHSHSLLGGHHHGAIGQARLAAAVNALVVDGRIGGNPHVLRDRIQDDRLFSEYLNRLTSIPDYYIRATVKEAAQLGLSVAEAQALEDFLLARRASVGPLISQNKAAFPRIGNWRVL
jgi:hypothetical protein